MTTSVHVSASLAAEVASRLGALFMGRGFVASPVSNPRIEQGWLHVDVKGSVPWTIKVDVSTPVRDKLPTVALEAPIRLLAHVSYARVICINDGQGLSIETARLTDIYAHVLADAIDVLEQAVVDADNGNIDLLDEFEGYFTGVPPAPAIRTSVEADSASRLVYAYMETKGKRPVFRYVAEREGELPAEFNTKHLTTVRALYAALASPVLPPAPGMPVDISFVERIRQSFGPAEEKLWQELAAGPWAGYRRDALMLVSQPRPSGGRSLIGLAFRFRDGALDSNSDMRVLKVHRHTASYMRERGGASNHFASKHVVILGCGSVGSEIADALASCGVGRLTLVDHDELETANVFRHAIGKHAIGQKKVTALRTELLRKYPGITVNALPKQAAAWLESAEPADVVVMAIGQPTVERELVSRLRASGRTDTIITTWLEPLGLGGHVVMLPTRGPGCLECLYRNDEGQPWLHPATSFTMPGQVVSRTASGCGGAFIPYSALHSRKTALMAADAVLEALSLPAARPSYRFWAGDSALAAASGIATSFWYASSGTTDSAAATQAIFGNPCPCCRGAMA